MLSVGLDMTEHKGPKALLPWLADHDPLTDLLTAAAFRKNWNKC